MKIRALMTCNQGLYILKKSSFKGLSLQLRWKDPYQVFISSSSTVKQGNWLLSSYFPLTRGLCIRLVYRKDCRPKQHPPQDEKKTAVVDSWPKNLDQTHSTNSIYCLPNICLLYQHCFTSNHTFAPKVRMERKFSSEVVTEYKYSWHVPLLALSLLLKAHVKCFRDSSV